jgi:hypothetical protein
VLLRYVDTLRWWFRLGLMEGKGIGRSAALLFAAEGAKVVVSEYARSPPSHPTF